MKEGLNLLIDNLVTTKNKLYTNLVGKGVQTITTASTLSEMADSVNLITTGTTITNTTENTIVYNSGWLVTPEELMYDYEHPYGQKHTWSWDSDFNNNQRKQLIYPTGDYIFSQDWDVVYYDGGGYVQAKYTNGSNYKTRNVYVCDDFFRYKSENYKLLCDTWNEFTNEQSYYSASELPMNNIEEFYINPTDRSNIFLVSASTYNEFKFYRDYGYDKEERQLIHPSNGNEYTFYPVVKKQPYYVKLVYDGSNSYDIVGGVIEFTEFLTIEDGVLTLPALGSKVTADYLLFNPQGEWITKFNYTFNAKSNNFEFPFDYHAKNITKIGKVTFNDRIKYIWYGFTSEYIPCYVDYVTEMIFNNYIQETNNGWMGDIEYCVLKNIGYNANCNSLILDGYYWGINEKYSNSRQSLVDSLITYSYDRASASYSTCTLYLNPNVKSRLTDDEIAAITAKGYTIA